MFLVFVIIFCAIVALGFGGAAAWSDYNRMIIPNNYVAFIGAAFVPAFLVVTLMAGDITLFSTWQSHLMAGGLVFAITYALFYYGVIGGGDAKMLSVYALWVGMNNLLPLLFFMALVGGLLGVATLILQNKKMRKSPEEGSWLAHAQAGNRRVPYGIAIFIGALASFWQAGYIQISTLVELATLGS